MCLPHMSFMNNRVARTMSDLCSFAFLPFVCVANFCMLLTQGHVCMHMFEKKNKLILKKSNLKVAIKYKYKAL